MTHRGAWISAFLDGQLSADDERRALAHVAECRACAQELEAARVARRALAAAADVAPAADLTARLLSLAPVAPARASALVDPFAPPGPAAEFASYGLAGMRIDALRGAPLRGQVRPRRSPARLVAGSVAGLGALAAVLFVLGSRPDVVPVSHPGTDLGLLGHAAAADVSLAATVPAATAGDCEQVEPGTGGDTTAWLHEHRWAFPTVLPRGWSLESVRWCADWSGADDAEAGQRVLELELVGPRETVVVAEQVGRLDEPALTQARRDRVGGHDALVLASDPWHVAWQAGDSVVQLVAARPSAEVTALVAAFPGGAYDDGAPARIMRGLQTVTGATQRP